MLKKVRSRVTKVVVYRTGAFVTRRAEVHLQQGNN